MTTPLFKNNKVKIQDTLASLGSVLTPQQISIDEKDLKFYGKDWTTYFDIQASAVLFPESTLDVVNIVKWAALHKIGLVPSGGRTGLSGAAVAKNFEVVVAMDRMNKVVEFSALDSSVKVQAGFVTEALQKYAAEKGLYYPVDFAARGSAQMGGTIATNAGGIKVVRYGMTRDWVLGLQVVTGTGEVLELNQGLIKNASGYDLRHLFVGSEGTLGFITEATLKLTTPPKGTRTLLLALPDLENVMAVFQSFRAKTQLLAFEFFEHKALLHVMANTGLAKPFPEDSPFYVVTEMEMASDTAEEEMLALFGEISEKSWIRDGLMAQSDAQAQTFWRYREQISESLSKYSPYKNDLSVKISQVPPLLSELDALLKKNYPTWAVVWFGHIGDGNLHINILRPEGMTKGAFVNECQKVDLLVFSTIQKYKGSISAEHGVGLTKKAFLGFCRSSVEIELMKSIKKSFDPHNILNPGKVFE